MSGQASLQLGGGGGDDSLIVKQTNQLGGGGDNGLIVPKQANQLSGQASLQLGGGGDDGGSTVMGEDDLQLQEETTVDEMKIQTMYKMVDDVDVNIDGQSIQKKVLYLTNKQAALFDETAMTRCIQALDIGDPKFVIKLCCSPGVESQMKISHEEMVGKPSTTYMSGSGYQSSELNSYDAGVVETQVLLFMRTCIIPLAKQTRAIILTGGANDCYLSSTLATVAVEEQARMGKDCPFTVVATAMEFEVHSRAVQSKDTRSAVSQLARGCPSWRRRLPTVSKILADRYGGNLQRCDLTPAASRYIIFESIDEDDLSKPRINSGVKKKFESVLLSALTKKLPSIAIAAFQCDSGFPYLRGLAARNIPVLLIDSYERAVTMKRLLSSGGPSTILAKESEAFPILSSEEVQRIRMGESGVTLEVPYLNTHITALINTP